MGVAPISFFWFLSYFILLYPTLGETAPCVRLFVYSNGMKSKTDTGVAGMRPLKTKVSITVDNDTLDQLRKLADEDERSLSNYINRILRAYVDQSSSGKKIIYTIENEDDL